MPNSRTKIVKDELLGKSVVESNLEYLSKASKMLASSLDYKTTLGNVARLAVPEIADWCSVTIKNGTQLEELAVAHVDPKKIKWAAKLRRQNPPDPNSNTGVPRILKTGKSELYPVVTDELIVKSARSKEELALIRKLKMSSVMMVPLLLGGKAMGVITFVAAESGRHYTKNDLKIAEEVASRMALAIENSRLYSEAKNVDELQKRLASIVESSDDAIISKSIKGIITSWNKGAEKLYGYKTAEIVGKPVSILMPPDKMDDFPMIMKKLQKGEKIEHYETRRLTKYGKVLDVSITVSPIRNEKGVIIGASKVARDITDRKKADERQKFLEDVSTILGSSIDYETTLKSLGKLIVPYMADYCRIVVLGEKNEIKEISINHTDPKKLGLVRELYNAYRNDNTTSGVQNIIRTGKSEHLNTITKDLLLGSSAKILNIIKELGLQSYMGVPMKVGKRVVGVLTFSSTRADRLYTRSDVALAEELARRAALAIENSRLYSESQKAVSLRDEFISIASHELKTPVTSLKMFLQVTKRQLDDKGVDTKNLDKMNIQINKLTLLIQDLLNVSRFQTGMLDYNDTSFNLEEVVKEVVENVQPTAPKHRIQIKGNIKKNVWGDKERIGQVLTNLLTNAVKYSPEAKKVIIHQVAEKDFAQITVEDFGIGIEKKHLSRLFERFYRVADPREKTFPGLGLGLYISNEIIKRYGGKMNVTSTRGKGSKFSFSLPYTKIK